ncbi:alcohol dehydrogenase catalytic domain-containing protein [Streptomyces sp. NPDC019224]|uniref:zinc-dependent alcohol dehydrogenase n=1 Tax=Streptomyces sp. NPDC019224 TaxID=3154484 RepID=UPI0033EFDC9E
MPLAIQYAGPRSIVTAQAARRPPGPGEVEIAPAYTGICGTDLHVFHGEMDGRVHRPAVLGHEMSGRVTAIGEGVTRFSPGAPVTVMPLRSCDVCAACRSGHRHICQSLEFIGIDSAGSLQERWTVPADVVIPLPPDIDLASAALVEPTAVAVHDVRRARVSDDDTVVVVGAGPIGVLIAVLARRAGGSVLVVEPDAYRRDFMSRLGFPTVDPGSEDAAAAVERWTEGAGASVAFEVSGAEAGLATAVQVLGVRGRLCLVAIHPRPKSIDLHRIFWRELTLVGARLYERSDFAEAVELIHDGTVPADAMISTIVPLGEAAEAFAAMESGRGVMKVLVRIGAGETR